MSEIFLFSVADPTANEAEAFSINLYESTDGINDWALVDSVLVSALEDDLSGKKRWNSELSNELLFHMLVSVSEAGIESYTRLVLPPRPEPSLCFIYGSTVDILGAVAEGITFKVRLYGKKVSVGGNLTSLDEHEFVTDGNGYTSFSAIKGVTLEIESDVLGKRPITVDTTGLDTINLATIG